MINLATLVARRRLFGFALIVGILFSGLLPVSYTHLIVLTFLLVIAGTFIVRSGVISSVHSFAQSAIGPFFFGFMAIMFIFSLVLITLRRDIPVSYTHLDVYKRQEE